MPAQKGDTWNESQTYRDAWTLRECRKITTQGEINQTPNYHTNTAFTADSQYTIFFTLRENFGAFCKANVQTGDITQLTDAIPDYGFNPHFQGGPYPMMCVAPKSRWMVYTGDHTLRAVHLDTLEERVLIENIDRKWEFGYPSISADEQTVMLPLSPNHPEVAAGKRVTKHYFDHYADGKGIKLQLIHVPITGGESKIVYQEDGCRTYHCCFSPVDNHLALLDRDFPPRYWSNRDGIPNRIYKIDLSTNELTALPSQNDFNFQVHCVWSFDATEVIYHGRSASGGYFIGACDSDGNTIREWDFPGATHYGHVGAMPDRKAILLDGNLSSNLLTLLYYDHENPRVEVLAEHNSQWGTTLGQSSHPHPYSSPDGKWVAFNTATRARTDVVVIRV